MFTLDLRGVGRKTVEAGWVAEAGGMFVLASHCGCAGLLLLPLPTQQGSRGPSPELPPLCPSCSAQLSSKDNLATRTSINTASSGCSLRERLGQRRTKRLASWQLGEATWLHDRELKGPRAREGGARLPFMTHVPTPKGLWPAQSPSSLQEITSHCHCPRGRLQSCIPH